MKRILLPLILIFFTNCVVGQAQLSERARISVITLGPWQGELYSAFGHSAIRVYDPLLQIDFAYNYGVFDFDQPNFYLNFTKGHLLYMLGVYPYPYFEAHYISQNRYVHEQILNLTGEEVQAIFNFLETNAKPENRNYLYDYFYDNCSTRPRDVLDSVLVDQLEFDGSFVKENSSIRELTDLYLGQQPWGDLGIDICLGLPMDKDLQPWDYMFLPDYLEIGLDHTTINHKGIIEPLVKEKKVIYEARAEESSGGLPHPLIVFCFVLVGILFITWRDLKRRKLTQWLDVILFAVTGLIGTLLLVLWVFTDHRAAATNFNLLWALPTHLALSFLIFKNASWIKKYFLIAGALQILLLLTWPLLPQDIHYALVPIVVALLARCSVQYYLR